MAKTATVQVLGPTKSSASSFARTVAIGPGIEIQDISRDDITGDRFDVVPARVDLSAKRIVVTLLDSGRFADVPRSGFNGYAIRFNHLGRNAIAAARVSPMLDTLGLPSGAVTHTRNTVFVNVDNLPFQSFQGFVIDVSYDTFF